MKVFLGIVVGYWAIAVITSNARDKAVKEAFATKGEV